jgi:hypothetical protein
MDIQQALADAASAALADTTASATPTPAVPAPADTQDDTPAAAAVEAPEDTTAVTPEDTTEDAEPSEAEATEETTEEATPELPGGYVAVPTVTEGLATEFTLKDAEGEVEVPDLIVEYKANGKVRQDRLDKVVKLAQFGVYNEEREQKMQQAERDALSLKSEREELSQLIEEREAQLERLLTDEDYFLAVRDAFSQENSPERRAQRAEQQVKDLRVQTEMQRITEAGQQFYTGEVQPAIQLIAEALPSVSRQELEERMAYAMQLHAAVAPNGQTYLPASQFDAARQYIVQDLAIWAQMQHARRSESAPSPQVKEAQAAVAKAQVEAQKAKRAVGQATKPVGRAASNTPAKPKAAKPATVDDALDSAMSEIMASIR